jgi:hypothetical protein
MKTVPTVRPVDTTDAVVLPCLPEEIALAMTDIAAAAREGLRLVLRARFSRWPRTH